MRNSPERYTTRAQELRWNQHIFQAFQIFTTTNRNAVCPSVEGKRKATDNKMIQIFVKSISARANTKSEMLVHTQTIILRFLILNKTQEREPVGYIRLLTSPSTAANTNTQIPTGSDFYTFPFFINMIVLVIIICL